MYIIYIQLDEFIWLNSCIFIVPCKSRRHFPNIRRKCRLPEAIAYRICPFSMDDVFVGGQLLQPHGAAGVQLLGGDAHLAAEAELAAVGEAGGGVDVDRRAVHSGDEARLRRPVRGRRCSRCGRWSGGRCALPPRPRRPPPSPRGYSPEIRCRSPSARRACRE